MCCWTSLSYEYHSISCRCATTWRPQPQPIFRVCAAVMPDTQQVSEEVDLSWAGCRLHTLIVAWISNHLRNLSCTVFRWWKEGFCSRKLWRRWQTWTLQWIFRSWTTDQICWWIKLNLDVVKSKLDSGTVLILTWAVQDIYIVSQWWELLPSSWTLRNVFTLVRGSCW